jgi:four helix bundle protein
VNSEVAVQDFRKLLVREKAHRLTLRVYEATDRFPREELFGLTQQMRRSSSSIPTNMAEGCGRASAADFARFLQIAMGSACELEYQLILARDRKYLPDDRPQELETDLLEVKRMLTALIDRVRSNIRPVSTPTDG